MPAKFFSADVLERIRGALPPSFVVGQKVKLQRKGGVFKGLCPFHQEKTPSFVCDDRRATWHCFGCGLGGDVFAFLQKDRGYSFPEAVEELAKQAGITLPKKDPDAVKREAKRLQTIESNTEAVEFFRSSLKGSREARAYLAARKITPQEVDRFGIGWAPDNTPTPFGQFRNRVSFAIHDLQGRVVGFTCRVIGPGEPKYLNSAESEAFHKGHLLWNAHRARQPAHDGAPLLVVEGVTDVISVERAGFPAAVAPLGTAITPDQLRLLWHLSDVPVLCLDGDAAGRKAAEKAIRTAFPLLLPGRSLRFAALPKGHDPDSFLASHGPEALRAAVERAEPISALWWRVCSENAPTGSPEALAAIEATALEPLKDIPDDQLRRKFIAYVKDCVWRIGRREVIRSNGHSNHSTNPGSIKLTHGLGERSGFSLKEAVAIATMIRSGDVSEPKGISERARAALNEIAYVLGTVPENELMAALKAGVEGSPVHEVFDVLHAAGITSLDPVRQ